MLTEKEIADLRAIAESLKTKQGEPTLDEKLAWHLYRLYNDSSHRPDASDIMLLFEAIIDTRRHFSHPTVFSVGFDKE